MGKRIILLLTAVALVLFSVVAVSAFDSDELEILPGNGYSIGDVDMSKDVNVKDASAIQKYLAKLEAFSKEQELLADADFDGNITVKDVSCIQRKVAKLG